MKLFFKRRPAVSSAAACKDIWTIEKAGLLSMYFVASFLMSICSIDSLFYLNSALVGDPDLSKDNKLVPRDLTSLSVNGIALKAGRTEEDFLS